MESIPFPKTFLDFVDETIAWFGLRATRNQWAYNGMRVCLVVLSAALPALTANRLFGFSTVAAVVVAALAGLDTQFKPGEQWKHHRSMQIALEAMKRDYKKRLALNVSEMKGVSCEDAVSVPERIDPFEKFYTDVRTLLEAEANQFWQLRITQWPQEKK